MTRADSPLSVHDLVRILEHEHPAASAFARVHCDGRPHLTRAQRQTELDNGSPTALDELFPLVYQELRAFAHQQRRRWDGDSTLATTALVHEARCRGSE